MPVAFCKICSYLGLQSNHGTIISQLQKILPQEFHHKLCSYEGLDGSNFRCTLRLKLTTELEVNHWLKAFQAASFMTWRVLKTYPDAGRFNKYRVDLRCQHNTRPKAGVIPKRPGKDTQCPAMMYLIVKRSSISRNRRSRSQDQHIHEGFFFIVNLRNEHNHDLLAAEFMRKRDVSKETADALKELYQRGHTPTSALDTLKYNLQEEFGEKYDRVLGDRALCPDLQFCYRLYYNMAKQSNGNSTEEMFKNLEGRLASFNQEQSNICAKMKQVNDKEIAVAMCTPLMRRVHANVEHSAEIAFVDSSGKTDCSTHHLFVLLTHTAMGGLPLGVLVTTSATESVITAGLELLQSVFPEDAFHGQGATGPKVTVTCGTSPLRQAIHTVFLNTELMPCVSHILQATWTWLWDCQNDIATQDKPALLTIVKEMVYTDSRTKLDEKYCYALDQELVHKYANFQEYLSELYQMREDWAICYQDRLPLQQDLNSELSGVALQVFKDKILYRMKTYSLSQLVDFILRRMDASYERRLLEITKKGMNMLLNSKYFLQGRDLNRTAIVQMGDSYYTVPNISSGQEHLVNMELGTCTCPVGMKGGPCKHQHVIAKKFKLANFDLISTLSPQDKQVFQSILAGKEDDARSVSSPGPVSESTPDVATTAVESMEVISTQEIVTATNILVHEQEELQTQPVEPAVSQQCSREHSHDSLGVSSQQQPSTSLEHKLRKVFNTISEKLQSNPSAYRTAVRSFVTNFENLQTDSAVVSALYTFGKSPGEAAATKRLKVAARNSLQRASQFQVQPSVDNLKE